MSIQWADDFSRYGTGTSSRTAMLDGLPYANLGADNGGTVTASPDPNDSGRAFLLGQNGGQGPQRSNRVALPTVVSGTVGICIRAWLTNLPTIEAGRPDLISIQKADGGVIVSARISQNGAITIVGLVANVLTQIFDSINPIISPGSFNHYELVHNTAAGTGKLYINGVERISYTGVDTAINMVFVNFANTNSGSFGGSAIWIKDLYIWDGTGTQNNTVAGTVIVGRLKPNADVTLGGFVPSTGTTGFNLLAKDAPNDATYIAGAGTPLPAPSRFELENLPPDVTSVRGLITVNRMRKIDGGDANVQAALTPNNGTNYDLGANRPITSAFTYFFDVSELDPASATPWAPTAVNSAQQRLDRTV